MYYRYAFIPTFHIPKSVNLQYYLRASLYACAGSSPARGVPEISNGDDLWEWSRLEMRLNAFRQSTIPQKQFIIFIQASWLGMAGLPAFLKHCFCLIMEGRLEKIPKRLRIVVLIISQRGVDIFAIT